MTYHKRRPKSLTERERDVLNCLADDLSVALMASKLGISPTRVKEVIRHIRRQLGLATDAPTNTIVNAGRLAGYLKD